MAIQCTKFVVSSLSRFSDILHGIKVYNGSRDVTALLFGTVCHP